MPILVQCAVCTTQTLVPDNYAGRQLVCPKCQALLRIPGGAPPPGNPLLDMLNEELGGTPAATLGPAVDPTAGLQPHRSRRLLRLTSSSAVLVAIAGAAALYVLILLSLPKLAVPLGWLLVVGGLVVMFCGVCWQTYVALREEPACAVLSIVVFPFYLIYYASSRWKRARLAFLTAAGGTGMCAGGILGILIAAWLIQERENPSGPEPVSQAAALPNTPPARGPVPAPAAAVPPSVAGTPKPASPSQPAPSVQPGAPPISEADKPMATDLVTFEGPKLPGATPPAGSMPPASAPPGPAPVEPPKSPPITSPPLPAADPSLTPVEQAFEEASRAYVARAVVDLVRGEEQALDQRVRWFPHAKRACIGLRWGLGVRTAAGQAQPASGSEKLIGQLSLKLVGGLEKRITLGQFGDWPEGIDPRIRLVTALKNGRQEELLAAARRRGIDLVVAVDPSPGQLRVELMDVVEETSLRNWSAPVASPQVAPTAKPPADPVATLSTEFFKFVDESVVLQPVSWSIVEPLKQRMLSLADLGPKLGNSANVLAEVWYYQNKKLVLPDKVAPLYDAILGRGRGDAVAKGTDEQRRDALEAWLKEL